MLQVLKHVLELLFAAVIFGPSDAGARKYFSLAIFNANLHAITCDHMRSACTLSRAVCKNSPGQYVKTHPHGR